MLLILVVGGPMGWKARKASLQRRAMSAIGQANGSVVFDFQSPDGVMSTGGAALDPPAPLWLRRTLGDEYFREITGVSWNGSHDIGEFGEGRSDVGQGPSPSERASVETLMASLTALDRLRALELSDARLSPAALADFRRLTGLTTFDSRNTIDSDDQMAALADLSRLEHLSIKFNEGSAVPRIDDAGLAHLAGLTRLRSLRLEGFSIRAGSLDFLERMSGLEVLEIEQFSPRDPSFARKIASLPRLRELSLAGTRITDDQLADLSKAPGLEHLYFDGEALTDAGLAHLATMKGLKSLHLGLRCPKVTDAGLAHLAKLDRLEALSLSGASVTDAGLAHLSGLTALRELSLKTMPITDAGLAHLSKLIGLHELDLSGTRVTGAGLARLPSPATLETLTLIKTPVDDAGLVGLAGMTSLAWLDLRKTAITDAGLPQLTGLTKINTIFLDDTRVTRAGFYALRPKWAPPIVHANQWNKP